MYGGEKTWGRLEGVLNAAIATEMNVRNAQSAALARTMSVFTARPV
jgi:hypothetical protein